MGWNIPRGLHGHAMTAFDGTFLSADEAFCEIVGRDVPLLQSLNILDITHDWDRAPNHDALEQLAEQVAALVGGDVASKKKW